MLACDQPALIVDGVAVRIVGALAENRDFAGGLDEPHHAIVRNVRPDEIAPRREPGRTFSPARPRPQTLDPHVTGEASLEARIENDDVRSLDLTIPHRNPAFLVHFAGPRSGCSIECRSSRKRGGPYCTPKTLPSPACSSRHRYHRYFCCFWI